MVPRRKLLQVPLSQVKLVCWTILQFLRMSLHFHHFFFKHEENIIIINFLIIQHFHVLADFPHGNVFSWSAHTITLPLLIGKKTWITRFLEAFESKTSSNNIIYNLSYTIVDFKRIERTHIYACAYLLSH